MHSSQYSPVYKTPCKLIFKYRLHVPTTNMPNKVLAIKFLQHVLINRPKFLLKIVHFRVKSGKWSEVKLGCRIACLLLPPASREMYLQTELERKARKSRCIYIITTYLIKELWSNSSLKEDNQDRKRSTFHDDEKYGRGQLCASAVGGTRAAKARMLQSHSAGVKAVLLRSGVALKSITQKHGAR